MTTDPPTMRTLPVQSRASERIVALIDAAAAVVDELGPDLLTTTLVAERAGAGVGTLYRYFPDRIALLQGIADRNVRVLVERFDEVARRSCGDLMEDLHALFHAYVALYRTLPGFRAVRMGESLPTAGRPRRAVVHDLAELVTASLRQRHADRVDDGFSGRLVDCFDVIDAVVAAAFADDPDGDARQLALADDVGRAMIEQRLLRPSSR